MKKKPKGQFYSKSFSHTGFGMILIFIIGLLIAPALWIVYQISKLIETDYEKEFKKMDE